MAKRSANISAPGGFLLNMHPLKRVLLSVAAAIIVFVGIKANHFSWPLTSTAVWDSFAITFIITSWIVFFKKPVTHIKQQANVEDGSRLFVMVSIIISSFASMFTVLLLMISKEQSDNKTLAVILALTGMIASWTLVHTIFTFHYAHLYYADGKDDTADSEALEFPRENKPDYVDFAYFSFVIGMTFQVSDVEINSRIIRRTVLAHGLLSFALNTFVVALTINLIAGLSK